MTDTKTLLSTLDYYFNQIKGAATTTTRKKYGEMMIVILKEYPIVNEYWDYCPNEYMWVNKFNKKKDPHFSTMFIENGIVRDATTNLLSAPSTSGLYLIGQTSFNPYTKEEQYWVKVGYSSDIWSRFKSGYATHCPCTALIDTTSKGSEVYCHNILCKKAKGRCQINTEWWLVDRDTYLEICEKKFNYFFG